jgi:hypothetical protein
MDELRAITAANLDKLGITESLDDLAAIVNE